MLQRNALSQKAVVDITEVRYNTGLASKLDVAQAKSVYYSTLASIPATESGIIQYMNALAVLLGLYPQDVTAALETGKPLPDYIEPVGVGLPGPITFTTSRCTGCRTSSQCTSSPVGSLLRPIGFPHFF